VRAVRGKWLGQVALIRRLVHRPRRAIGRRSGAHRRPCPRPPYACKWHWHVPTYPNRPSPALISQPRSSLARTHFHPSRRRPPLPPLDGDPLPVAFLTHPRTSALPCAPQHLPEPLIDQAEPSFRWNPSSRCRRLTAAIELAPRRFSKPGDLPSAFSGSHGSSPCSTWLSPGPALTAVRFPAGAPPPPLAGDFLGRSTATNRSRVSPIDNPCRLFVWPCPPRRRRACHRRRARGGRNQGHLCEDFKRSRVRRVKRLFSVLCLSPAPCKID
jgi:hypothetical protein